MEEWLSAPAAEMGRAIEGGTLDPLDLTEAFLARASGTPEGSQIYARLTADRAREEAAAARDRARRGMRLSPLDGVPISWKDLFDSAGTATEAGTPLLAGRVPGRDAEVLRRATAAGLVCLGKTHMSEIAFSGLGYNPMTATPPNRQGAELVPGGSSSGAAASVAHDMAAIGIGSDTGGSVRVPAAWNDLVGFKTTSGLLPLTGVVPLCLRFDTVGPLARTVEDAALMGQAMGAPAVDLAGARLAGRRFLVLRTILLDDLEGPVQSAFLGALEAIRSAGAEVVEADWPALEEAYALAGPLYTAEAWALWRDRIRPAPEKMFGEILERVQAGEAVAAADYIAAWERIGELRADYAALTAGFDAVLCPTTAGLPPRIAEIEESSEAYKAANLKALRNTRLGNLMGLCGLSLPTGTPHCGLLLNGAPGEEARLLRLGQAVAAALD